MRTTYGRIAVFILFLLLTATGYAQIDWQANFFIQPYPSPYLSDWEYNRSTASLTLYNYSDSDIDVIVHVTVSRQNGELIGRVNSNRLFIPQSPPPTILNSDDIFDWDSAEYGSNQRDIIIRTGRLPEGNFEACARITDINGEVLIEDICAYFSILYPEPPMLLMPNDQDTIALHYQTFQWTPVILPPEFQALYSIKIAEVNPGQQPERALQANQLHHEEYDITSNLYQYPIDGYPFEPSKQYAWQVSVFDQNGMPAVSNDGHSQIWTFFTPDTTTHEEPEKPGRRDIVGHLTGMQSMQPLGDAKAVYRQLEQVWEGDSIAYYPSPDSEVTTTNDSGRLRFSNVADSSFFSITISKTGYIDEYYLSNTYETIGDVDLWNLYLTADYADIAGRVAQIHSDQPLPFTSVELWRKRPIQESPGGGGPDVEDRLLHSARADSAGNFVFSRIPGGSGYYLKIDKPKYEPYESSNFKVIGGIYAYPGTNYLTPKYGAISGTVRDSLTNNMITNAIVYIYADSASSSGVKPDNPFQPSRPDNEPIAGPDTTDFAGHFNFSELLLNEFEQPADRYVLWVEKGEYKTAMRSARITEMQLNTTVDFSLLPQPGMIQGVVTSSVDGSPIGDARVELQVGTPQSIRYGAYGKTERTAYTNPDGSYSITDIEEGSYAGVVFFKRGYEIFGIPGPIEIVNGRIVTIDAQLRQPVGVITGRVVNEDDNPLYGVTILSPNAPGISGYTEVDGTFILNNVPATDVILDFNLPGHSGISDTLTVESDDTANVNITMQGYRGSITITVKDSTSNSPIANATVYMSGMEEQLTDNNGSITFNRIPVGPKRIRIVPPNWMILTIVSGRLI